MKELFTKNGNVVPHIGLGTFPLKGQSLADVFASAVSVGYRLFDTSDDYQNEDGIGLGLKKALSCNFCNREDLFIQTKVSDCDSYLGDYRQNAYFRRFSTLTNEYSIEEIVRSKVANSLEELGTDYIDSVLLHFAYPQYYEEMWKALVNLKNEGIVRYIGVSNFNVRELEVVSKIETPEVNEIYISPFGTKSDIVNYCETNNIQVMTYSPLAVARGEQFNHSVIQELQSKYNKSRAQIILRWNVQVGSIPLPKSSKLERLKDNFSVLDFSFTKEEMELLSSLNINHQYPPVSKDCPGI